MTSVESLGRMVMRMPEVDGASRWEPVVTSARQALSELPAQVQGGRLQIVPLPRNPDAVDHTEQRAHGPCRFARE